MKQMKFIIFLLIVAILAGGGVYFFMSSRTVPKEEPIKLANLDLQESLIKLSDENSYIKTSITLSYDESEENIDSRVPLIRDTIIQYFMSKSSNDFNGETLEKLKEELIKKINTNIGTDIVKQIYFTNLVVQ